MVAPPVITRNQILVTAIMAAVTGITMWLVGKGIGAIETGVARRRENDLEKASPPQQAPQQTSGMQANGAYELPRPSHVAPPGAAPQHNVRTAAPRAYARSAPAPANAAHYRGPPDWAAEASRIREEMNHRMDRLENLLQARHPDEGFEEVG